MTRGKEFLTGDCHYVRDCPRATLPTGTSSHNISRSDLQASDDEGFTLSVTSKLREFTALGYPSHVLNGAIGRAIGRAFARTRDERLFRARLCSQRWEANL